MYLKGTFKWYDGTNVLIVGLFDTWPYIALIYTDIDLQQQLT